MPLVLGRRLRQTLTLRTGAGETIEIGWAPAQTRGQTRIMIWAPPSVHVVRTELLAKDRREARADP